MLHFKPLTLETWPDFEALFSQEAFYEEYMGQRSMLEKAGFTEVLHRSERWCMMRREIKDIV